MNQIHQRKYNVSYAPEYLRLRMMLNLTMGMIQCVTSVLTKKNKIDDNDCLNGLQS